MSEVLDSRTSTATATGSAVGAVIGGIMLGYGIRRLQAEQEAIAAAAAAGDNDASKMSVSAWTYVLIIFGIILGLVSIGMPYLRRDKGEAPAE